MSQSPFGTSVVVLIFTGMVYAQSVEDRPSIHVPRVNLTQKELDRRESQRFFAQGALQERNNRLVEAISAFEAAARLDPSSSEIQRALYPLYLAVERTEDAIAACRVVLARDPEDFHTAYHLGRQLRGLERRPEALAAFELATRSKRMKERPDLAAQVWFDLSVLHEQGLELGKAITCLKKCTRLLDSPSSILETGKYSREEVRTQAAETWERLGRLCLQSKRINEAIKAFETAQSRDPLRAPRLAFNLARVYRDQGKLSEAIDHLDRYLASQPQNMDGYEMKIALLRELKRDSEILPGLEAATRRDPHNVPLELLLGREYRKNGQQAEARRLYDKLLEIHVTPDVYRGLFELHKERGSAGAEVILSLLNEALEKAAPQDDTPGDSGVARRARSMLIVLREDSELVRVLLPAALRRARGNKLAYMTTSFLATLATRAKLYQEGESLFRECLERSGGPGPQEAEVYLGLIQVLRAQHKDAELVEVCKRGLRQAQQTNRVAFHETMVFAYLRLNRHKEALQAADAAVNDSGKSQLLRSKRNRVMVLSQIGENTRALADCQALLKEYNSGGELRDVRYSLSNVYQSMGKLDEAEQELQKILQADSSDVTANNDLGYFWADRGKNLEEAERLIRKALDLDRQQRNTGLALGAEANKDNAAYVDSLGWVLFRRGKLEDARKELERAAKLAEGEEDPVIWDHLGDVYSRLNLQNQAIDSWKKALALFDLGSRRKTDERYREIQEKIRLVKP